MASNPASVRQKLLPTARRLLLEARIRRRLPQVGGRVLVIGAGHDPYRDFLDAADWVVSTDIDAEVGAPACLADAHQLPFADESFDAVVALEVFEHLHSPQAASAEMLRVMRKGSLGIVSIPFMFHVHGDPNDYTRLTRSGLAQLFGGFSDVRVSSMGGRLHVISDLITTGARWLAPLRLVNHALANLARSGSDDCPTGYWVEVAK
ncbi:MAG TPA: class I SAM-dependent methyltransferase [Phenylobacterium sp.]|nr:class I SAM-dependent methyltransferase [Phenylobacterium sp.]